MLAVSSAESSSIMAPDRNPTQACASLAKGVALVAMARLRSSDKRTKKLSAPANEHEIEAYYAACRKVDIEPADTLRKLARALVEHVERVGYVVQPIRFAPPPKD